MALTEFQDDLNIIQKLDDEPNDVGGLTAAELKAKFDEAGLMIQNWLNTVLLPALVAANLGFQATRDIPAETVQAAIENVQEQVKQATIVAVPNGSINYIKLAQDVTTILTGLRTDITQSQADITELQNRPIIIDPATASANGLMSKEDKAKLDGIAAGATKVFVNNELSATSSDAIMNKVVYAALQNLSQSLTQSLTEAFTAGLSGKANTVHTHVLSDITTEFDSAPTEGSNNLVKSGGVYTAIKNIKNAFQYTGTLLSTGWTVDANGYQTQTITITGLAANYAVDPQWDVVLSGTDHDADMALLDGFSLVHNFTTGADSLTAQCLGVAPTVNIPVKVVVFV